MNIFGRNGQVSINGKTYVGNNINIQGNKVYIDGEIADGLDNSKRTEIKILCNVDKIISDESIYITGVITGNVEARTSVNCDTVFGNVTAGTSVNCDDVHGDVTAGTVVNCDNIEGKAIAPRINR